jgi:hypothetical protein
MPIPSSPREELRGTSSQISLALFLFQLAIDLPVQSLVRIPSKCHYHQHPPPEKSGHTMVIGVRLVVV